MDYEIKITFSTNVGIDEFEVEDLLSALLAQVEEPANWKGEQARYETSNILIDIKP